MISKKEQNISLFNYWSSSYDNPLFQFWMRGFYRPALKEIDLSKRIIDVSCGTGELLHELSYRGAKQVYGTDLSPKMIRLALRKVPHAHIQEADACHLPFNNNSFDYVISTEAFHHYYDQPKALEEMKRVCTNKGKIIVVDLNFFLPIIHRLLERFEPGCVKVNNKDEMKQLFQHAGLKVETQQRSFLFAVMTIGIPNQTQEKTNFQY